MRLVSAHRGSALRNRRTDLRYCIPTCVRRFVPRCCIPTRVRRTDLPPTDVLAPPRPVLHFLLSAAAQLAAFNIFGNVSNCWQKNAATRPRLFPNHLETFPIFDYSILPLFDFVNPFFSFFHFFSRRIAFFLRLHAISDCYILVRSSFLHSSHRTLRRRRSQRIVPQKRRARWAVLTNSALAVQDAPQSLQKGSPHAAYRT